MKIRFIMITAALLALISAAFAQNPIDAVAGSLQEQVSGAGEQLQQQAVQYVAEGNLTREHITQDLNATRENLTGKAKQQLEEKLNQRINQQPGFPAILAVLVILAAGCLIKRRN